MNMAEEQWCHAWFSADQGKIAGIVAYPNRKGILTNVTEVNDTAETRSKWEDMKYLGKVNIAVNPVRIAESNHDREE